MNPFFSRHIGFFAGKDIVFFIKNDILQHTIIAEESTEVNKDIITMEKEFSFRTVEEVQRFFNARRITPEKISSALEKHRKNISENDRKQSCSDMEKYLTKFAPAFLEEFSRMDQALSLKEGSFFEFFSCNTFVPEKEKLDCTSWIVTPEWTTAGKMLLHKTRDSHATEFAPLFFHTPGKFSFLASTSIYSADPLMGINEKGLTVAMNSGEICSKWNRTGFGTPTMARILLENCATPEEAANLVEEMRRERAYSHMYKGSIFFYADANKASITEFSSEHSQSLSFDFGYMIRANAWHLPGMEAVSDNTTENILNYNIMREHLVRTGLREAKVRGGVRARDCFAIMRNRGKSLDEGQEPVCRKTSNSSGTFEIDPEYPLLSTCYHASGPTRNTLVIPIPFGAGAMPRDLVSGEWTSQSFRFKEHSGIDHESLEQMEEVENLLCIQHEQAIEQARLLLRMRREEDARNLLCEHFRNQFACAKKHFMRITGQKF